MTSRSSRRIRQRGDEVILDAMAEELCLTSKFKCRVSKIKPKKRIRITNKEQ